MPIGSKERPAFFELFKARCSKAELGLISLNWFEELTAEAPPYKPESAEEPESKVSSNEPVLFKTPQRKPYCNELASTPIIFTDAGKEPASTKQKSQSSQRARVTQARDVTGSPLQPCLSGSPLPRCTHVTPQREKSVMRGSLFHTPKLTKGQTPKRISESLGAEVDPDMSWSSSLATPPTLSSTLLLARDDRPAETALPREPSAHHENRKENKQSIPCLLDEENENQGDLVSQELGEMLGNLFDDVSSHDDCFERSEPSTIEKGGHDTVTDISEEDSFTFCVTKYKTGNKQKRKTGKTRKTVDSRRDTGQCEVADALLKGKRPAFAFAVGLEDSDPFCSILPDRDPTENIQDPESKEAVTPSAEEWSPLALSGLNATQVEKKPSSPISSCDQNHSEKDQIDTEKNPQCKLPRISGSLRTETVLEEDAGVDGSCGGQHMVSHKDSVLEANQTPSGTSLQTASLQSVKPSLLKKGESPVEAPGAVLTGASTDPDFKEKSEAWGSDLEADADGSQRVAPSCPLAVADGNFPVTPKQPAVTLRSAGLISTLKKKTKKFIYSVSDGTSYPRAKIEEDQDCEPVNAPAPCPAQLAAPGAGVLHPPVKTHGVQNGPEEPTLSLASAFQTILGKSSHNERGCNYKVVSPGLDHKEPKSNTADMQSLVTAQEDCVSFLQEHRCDGDVANQRVSAGKENVLAGQCHPALQESETECSAAHTRSQKTALCNHHNASTLILTPSSRDPLPTPAEISAEKEDSGAAERLTCKNYEAALELTKNVSMGKNQETYIFDENSRKTELTPPEMCMKVASPSTKVKFNQTTYVTFLQKDREEMAFISQVAIKPNSELFPGNEDDFAPQVMRERHAAVPEDPKEHQEASCPGVGSSPVLAFPQSAGRQGHQVLVVQDSDSSDTGPDLSEEDRREKQHSKLPLCLDLQSDIVQIGRKSRRNSGYVEKRMGLSSSISNASLGSGFRTASNKAIKLSEHNIKKSKALFKDIEEQFPQSLACLEIVNAFPAGHWKKPITPRALGSAAAHAASVGPQGSAFVSDEEKGHSAPQSRTLERDSESNPSLTPSQKAEITELSSILEESGSQFEFTQFRKPSHIIEDNAFGRYRNQVKSWNHAFENRRDFAADLPASSQVDVKLGRASGSKQQVADWQEGDCKGSWSSSHLGQSAMESTGFCSARGTKIRVSRKALHSALRLLSDVEDFREETSAQAGPGNFLSRKCDAVVPAVERKNLNHKSLNEKHTTLQSNTGTTAGVSVEVTADVCKRNAKDEENVCPGTSRSTYSFNSSDNGCRKNDGTDTLRAGNSSSPITDQEHSRCLKRPSRFTKERVNDVKEGLSDLTCLEAVKAEETLHVETSSTEQLAATRMGPRMQGFGTYHLPFQTASGRNISVSRESLNKVAHLFDDKFAEELGGFAHLLNSERLSDVNNEMDNLHYEKRDVEKHTQKGSNPIGAGNKLLAVHHPLGCEIGKTRGPAMLGFHTASGKKVTISKESLNKVKQLFEEEERDHLVDLSSFPHQGAAPLKDRDGCKDGLQLTGEAADMVSVPESEETERPLSGPERNLVSSETTEVSDDLLYGHTGSLPASTRNSSRAEVHENLGKEATESPRTCVTDRSTSAAHKNPAFVFHTGHGQKISVSQTSLCEVKEWLRDRDSEDQPRQRNTAEVSHATAGPRVRADTLSQGTGPDSMLGNSRRHLSEEEGLSPVSNNHLNKSAFCRPGKGHSQSGSPLGSKLGSTDIRPAVKNVSDRKSPSVSEATATGTKAGAPPREVRAGPCAQEPVTDGAPHTARPVSSGSEGGPLALRTASAESSSAAKGSTAPVREDLTEHSCQSCEPQADSCGRTAVDVTAAHTGSEGSLPPAGGGDGSRLHSGRALNDRRDTRLSCHHQNVSGSGKVSETPSGQVNLQTSIGCVLNLGELRKPISSLNTCGIFSTASGKSVHVSDASLQKARCMFSEIEDGAVLPISERSHQNHGGNSKKAVLCEKNTLILANHKPPSPQEGALFNVANSPAFSGFSTASGKQVSVSESALHRVKGMLEESDLIANECSPQLPPCRRDGTTLLPPPYTDRVPRLAVERRCMKEFQPARHSDTGRDSLENYPPPRVSALPSAWGQPGEQHSESESRAPAVENIPLWGKEQACLRNVKMTIGKIKATSHFPVGMSHEQCRTSFKDPEASFETEAVAIAKAFMEDDELIDLALPRPARRWQFTCPADEERAVSHYRVGKRRDVLVSTGEPPMKRSLLNEFDRIVQNQEKSLQVSKSTPDATIKDRRLFMHRISLKPVTCTPFCTTKERQERRSPNFTAPRCEFLPRSRVFEHLASEKLASVLPESGQPPGKWMGNEETRHSISHKPTKVFVPPFKTKHVQSSAQCAASDVHLEGNKEMLGSRVELGPGDGGNGENSIPGGGMHRPHENSAAEPGEGPRDLMTSLENARDMQASRIQMKERQRVCPQPGSLYLTKTSSVPRVSLRAAVGGRRPSAYSPQQLYMFGVSKHCVTVNSRNAESFQFHLQDYFGKEGFWAENGVQLADGGWLIPSCLGKAGKEEFYRALCDTPGVDPKLISRDWVYNHYRWIIWKLAAMEFSFPQEFANRCLSPERVLLQLKYRYDVEIDGSRRSAIKKVVERDDTAARTLVLCVSDIMSPSTDTTETPSREPRTGAVVELTDGWYAIRAQLDPPLATLLKTGRLVVGQKIITHGAELVGSQEACAPLEAPESLLLKISANSTRPACWYARLGFCPDPRPFSLPLSSLFSDGGAVGCVDVVIQRVYPVQWMEKMSSGMYIFRDERAEEKEVARHAEARQRRLDVLLARTQAELEEQEENTTKPRLPRHALTRQQLRALQDGAELYEAVRNAPDPSHLEGCFSEQQLRALKSHRQGVQDKRQARIQQELQKAMASAEQEEQGWARDVTAVWKLRVVDYRRKETSSVLLSIWRPTSELFSLLTEGKRYRIYHLTTSKSKRPSERTGVHLTATKRTQYQLLPALDEILFQVYQPREFLPFNKLLDPDFCPPCSEVDLIGFVISVVKRLGLAPLVYLSDEHHRFLAVKFWIDLNEDVIKPPTLIAVSNLQWRPESSLGIPTLCAGELAAVSASSKEARFQEAASRMRNTIENLEVFFRDAENRLTHMLDSSHPARPTPAEDCPSEWHATPAVLPKGKSLPTPPSAQETPRSCCTKTEDPKALKKMRALDFLSRLPLPPPVSPAHTFVSPAAQKAFQPPRNCGPKRETPQKRRELVSLHSSPKRKVSESSLLESDSIADEELALINTQAVVSASAGERPLRSPSDPPGTKPSHFKGHLRGQWDHSTSEIREREQPQTSTEETPPPPDT